MGIRADFYIGKGPNAEWLGSVAWHGHNWHYDKGCELFAAKNEDEFREAVKSLSINREDWTSPEQGWPWPWDDSKDTDFTYAFYDGKVQDFAWDEYANEDKTIEWQWPNMRHRSALVLDGPRSGLLPAIVTGIDENNEPVYGIDPNAPKYFENYWLIAFIKGLDGKVYAATKYDPL